MRLKAMTCLPRVAAHPEVIDLGDSRIVRLPFAEWLALEGQSRSAPYDKLDRRYSQNPPAFWEKAIDVDSNLVVDRKPENVRALLRLIERELEALVKSLHWYTGTAPIHPLRSVIYFDSRSDENFAAFPGLEAVIAEGGVQRGYGESEKEYATQNESPIIVVGHADAAPLAAVVAFARQTQDVWMGEQYELASQSLNLCSAPGLDWHSQILLLVGAYESLFLPDRTTGLQRGFAQRVSCMVANRFEEVSRYATWLKSAYQLRSDLIHGRPLTGFGRKMPLPFAEYVAQLSRVGVVALCRLVHYRHAHPEVQEQSDPLWAVLDSAGSRAEGFAALQALIGTASSGPIRHQWQARHADISDASS
jgi:hypothetical protein